MSIYDLVIRNGAVIDGTGLARYRADVAVTNGRIVDIGKVVGSASRTIDAEGQVVTPGFVDGHTHLDAQLFWDPLATSSSWHGVTTAVMGNCGFTLAPSRERERELVVRNLERAEDIPGEAMAAAIDWRWERFSEFLDVVDAMPKGINFAASIGHSALRTFVMGERAFAEIASTDDLARMVAELDDAISAGAVAFSTSRSEHHETSDGRPVASRVADWGEVVALVDVLSRRGAGVFQLALESAVYAGGEPERRVAFDRLRRLAISSGVPMVFGLSAAPWPAELDLVGEVNRAGGRMIPLSHSRGVAVVSSFATRLPFDPLPVWRELRALPLPEQRKRLGDPDLRARLVRSAHESDYGRRIGAEARRPDYGTMVVLERPLPPNPTVAELAAARGRDPVEIIIDLSLESDLRQLFVQPMRQVATEDLQRVLAHPDAVMTFSDAGAHVSQIMDCSIQTHLLGHWVRQLEAFTLEEAIRMITLAPARVWGFHDRGLLRPGLAADLNIIDPDRVGPELPEVTHDLPGGGTRLLQRATGIAATIVNGKVLYSDGVHEGAMPGALLRSGSGR